MNENDGLNVEVFADPAAVAQHVAGWLLDIATGTKGKFAVALSGGSTPRLLYQCLASATYQSSFPWARTHWFWGDERFVGSDDTRSNYRMVREAMLAHAPIPTANIHYVPTAGLTPEDAAHAYELELQHFYGAACLDPARPLFDVVFLGLGEDGHTASLFPGTAVLEEHSHWVAAVIGAKAETRITLTYPVLKSAHHAAFLVTGPEKREILNRFLQGETDLPATRIHPSGVLHVFADRAARP